MERKLSSLTQVYPPAVGGVDATPTRYTLRCPVCSAVFQDDGQLLHCPGDHAPGLLTTEYESNQLEPDDLAEGIYRYRRWLPISHMLAGSGKTVTYRSESLSAVTGLRNLWIAFNGYWPEIGATLETTTFKELEAYSVLGRTFVTEDRVLVVASAGNTAAAFALVCSRNCIPCLILVPRTAMCRLMFAEELNSCVRIVSLCGCSDYSDAIALAETVSQDDRFKPEGGVRNVARRDGLGTTLLDATDTIGQLPDMYFQAIGSGSGAIAVHEAAKRLIRDGRFGKTLPRLMLSQNLPFAPMVTAWKSRSRTLAPASREAERQRTHQIVAGVLSNSRPPYSVAGGVFDILTESKGDMMAVGNDETLRAVSFFEELEGIDIDPAAGVAVATLLNTAGSSRIPRDAVVLLHITGGGWRRRQLGTKLVPTKPALETPEDRVMMKEAVDRIRDLF